jgi:hypothetical protein
MRRDIQSVYKRTYIKSAVELCGSILFLTELCQAVEAGKLDIKYVLASERQFLSLVPL